MLEIECDKCKKTFFVKGYTTPDSYYEPGGVITNLECEDELCECLKEGESFTVIGESQPDFDDDV